MLKEQRPLPPLRPAPSPPCPQTSLIDVVREGKAMSESNMTCKLCTESFSEGTAGCKKATHTWGERMSKYSCYGGCDTTTGFLASKPDLTKYVPCRQNRSPTLNGAVHEEVSTAHLFKQSNKHTKVTCSTCSIEHTQAATPPTIGCLHTSA